AGWYFEASFPVELQDKNGNVIAQGPAQAQGDWMTDAYVPFEATLTFTKPADGETGTLILRKDNPSGLPEHDDFVKIPVKF
ncbi:MAG: Gmad2 immunoglobulin-like domain-containing protein, partial [Patescibacteria group bacterium]